MHTTIAFSATPGALGDQWVPVAAVADPHIKTEGNFIYIGAYNKIIGYHSLPGTGATMVRLSSPSIRGVNPYYVTPFETAVIPAADVPRAFWPDIALTLEPTEGLELEQYISIVAEVVSHVIFLAADPPSPVSGNIHTVRFSTEPTQTASAWEFDEITMIDVLPVGTYDIVGARVENDGLIAFRFVPIGGVNRPGGVGSLDSEVEEPILQRHGGLGVWCSFEHGLIPGMECLFAADVVAEKVYGFMDIIPR